MSEQETKENQEVDDGATERPPPPEDGSEVSEEGPDTQEHDALAVLEAERDKLKDQLLRTAADFDNFRKRTRKDLELAEHKGKETAIRELLPVIDNLERAIDATKSADDVEAIRSGVEMVLKQFEDAAEKLGLERLESVGQHFDPSLHDAMQQMETDEHPPGTILNEFVSGYRLGEKLIRPAMVVVARKPAE